MDAEPTANILVVDDDLKTLSAMETLLAGPGRRIVTAHSATEALRHLLHEDFALILLDVRLPEMDGFETAALIRQRERFRYTPIIFISAIDTLESDVFRGVISGAVDYLFKPVVPQVLQAKVSVFVDLFRMNEQLKQQALRQSEERFRLVVDSLQDYAVFMIDAQGYISTWNRGAEQIGGWKQEEIVGQQFGKFYTSEDQEKGLPALTLREAAAEGRHVEEGWRVRKNGAQFWADVIVTALVDDCSELLGFSAVIRDLTHRKQAEEELKRLNAELEERIANNVSELLKTTRERERLQEQLLQAQKLESIGTLAGGIAHDMNNLLSVIGGYASLLQRHPGEQRDLPECVGVINEMVRRGASLVQQLLAVARNTPREFTPVQANSLLETIRVLLDETFPKGIDLAWRFDPALPTVTADPNQLHQVILNMCLNARDAMPNGGKLSIETGTILGAELRHRFQEATEEAYAVIAIKDTGMGMDAATRSRIFEPFFTTKPQGQGSGLGLAVAYGIIINHKGFIDVESDPGMGTTFRVCLPVTDAQTTIAAQKQVEAARRSVSAGSGETILFVDDEPRQLQLVQGFLQSNGYKVLAARDGVEAVEVFSRQQDAIALVVLDIGLPKLNGWDAFCQMKSISPGVKAILATGFLPPELEPHITNGRLCGLIMKPYQLDDLLEKIFSALKNSSENTAAAEPFKDGQADPLSPFKNSALR